MNTIILSAPDSAAIGLIKLFEQSGYGIFGAYDQPIPIRSEISYEKYASTNESLCKLLHSNWYHLTNLPLGGTLAEAPGELKFAQKNAAANLNNIQNWVMVDPVMCFLLPAWQPFISSPNFIIYIEDPLVVARRLQEKWRFPMAFGVSLWEYYMRAALINTKAQSRVIISSGILYRNPAQALIPIHDMINACHGLEIGVPDSNNLGEEDSITDSSGIQQKDEVFLSQEQQKFYKSLLSGDTNITHLDQMSMNGDDSLKTYGRLRAGYELIKQEHKNSLREIVSLKKQQKQPTSTIKSKDVETALVDKNIELTVYIDGMAPLELICQSSNPIIEQLMNAMIRKARSELNDSELFYLQLGDRALYFPVSHLQGVETNEEELSGDPEASAIEKNLVGDDTESNSNRVAIVVLGCLLPIYIKAIETIRNTWASRKHPNIDIFYIYGAHENSLEEQQTIEDMIGQPIEPLSAYESRQFDDLIFCGCADSTQLQTDCLLRKRLIAFRHLSEKFDYDYIYTVCASSYVEQSELAEYVSSLNHRNVFHGPVGVCQFSSMPYISGASMLFSADLIQTLVENMYDIIEENQSSYADDVAIGRWIATNISEGSLDSIVKQIKEGENATSDDTFVRVKNKGMINYVDAEMLDHQPLPNIYHYHFKTDSVEHMVAFDRHFS